MSPSVSLLITHLGALLSRFRTGTASFVSRPSAVAMVAVAMVVVALAVQSASALDFGGSAGYEVTYSDNLTRVKNCPSDWEHTPFFAFQATQQSNVYQLSSQYRFEQRIYANETYPDDSIVSGTTQARVSLLPDTLDWTLSHSRQESAVNSRFANTPSNSQLTNVLATGPSLNFTLDGRTAVELSALYQDLTADRTDNDSTRWIGNAGVRRAIDANSEFGIQANHSDINFANEFGQDYRSTDVRLVYGRSQGSRTKLDIELGAVRVETEDRLGFLPSGAPAVLSEGEANFDWTGSLSLSREFTRSLSGSLHAERKSSDSGSGLNARSGEFPGTGGGRSDARQSFIETSFDVGLAYTGPRLAARAFIVSSDMDFDGVREDEKRLTFGLNGSYKLSARISLSSSASIAAVEFQEASGRDLTHRLGVQVVWQPLQMLTVGAGVDWENRDGARAISVDYQETSASVRTAYQF